MIVGHILTRAYLKTTPRQEHEDVRVLVHSYPPQTPQQALEEARKEATYPVIAPRAAQTIVI